jgi:GNAT superfamily N-acetyltransferase
MMIIRASIPKDADAISSLSSQLGYPLPPGEVAPLQASLLQLPDHRVFVAEDEEGRVRGWVHVFISRRLFVPPFAELGGIVVENTNRRSGIGSALLAKAEEWASEVGCLVFRIRTNTKRIDADLFYRDLGYKLSKTQSVYQKNLPPERHA